MAKMMTTDDPRWLLWYLQQSRVSRVGRESNDGPSLALDFANGVYEMGAPETRPGSYEFSDLVTITRSTAGGITNSSGQFEMVAANMPRLTYDPVTLQSLGMLVEEQRTNLVLQSGVLSTQSVTVTAVAHTLSFYGTGTVTLSGAATGSLVGAGAYPTRSTLTFTPTDGSLTLTVTGSVTKCNLEVGATASTYIPTTTAQVTRAADMPVVSTLSPWLNPLEGAIVVSGIKADAPGALCSVATLDDGTSANRVQLRHTGTTGGSGIVLSGGVAQAGSFASPAGSWPTGVQRREALSYKADSFAFSCGGSAPLTDNSGVVPAVTRLVVGAAAGGIPAFNGIIASITYYPRVIDVQQASA